MKMLRVTAQTRVTLRDRIKGAPQKAQRSPNHPTKLQRSEPVLMVCESSASPLCVGGAVPSLDREAPLIKALLLMEGVGVDRVPVGVGCSWRGRWHPAQRVTGACNSA